MIKPWTIGVLIVVTVGLIGFDIWVAFNEPHATISAVILHYARKYPSIPFCFGVLMGHFFFPQPVKRE